MVMAKQGGEKHRGKVTARYYDQAAVTTKPRCKSQHRRVVHGAGGPLQPAVQV